MKGLRPQVSASLALALLGAACAFDPQSPTQVVQEYFAALQADPTRTLLFLSDRFHREHGLRFESTVYLDDGTGRRVLATGRPPLVPRAEEAADPDFERYRARLGWATALTLQLFFERAPGVRFLPVAEQIEGDRARVEIRAEEWSGIRQTAEVGLSRATPAEPWRIDAIEVQGGPTTEEIELAFMISPSRDAFRRLVVAQEKEKQKAKQKKRRERRRPGVNAP